MATELCHQASCPCRTLGFVPLEGLGEPGERVGLFSPRAEGAGGGVPGPPGSWRQGLAGAGPDGHRGGGCWGRGGRRLCQQFPFCHQSGSGLGD